MAVDDLGVDHAGGRAPLTVRRDGEAPRTSRVPVGAVQPIEIPITRAGPTVVELTAAPLPGEVSDLNNHAVVAINGVRDRLRVLLVSGEPHAGERTWRRLLKADPAVDLVHFTILRPPEKDDLTPLNELALIAFPVRELFQVKIKRVRPDHPGPLLQPRHPAAAYLRNIADYVRGGGALLLRVGPEFSRPASPRLQPARPRAAGRAAERQRGTWTGRSARWSRRSASAIRSPPGCPATGRAPPRPGATGTAGCSPRRRTAQAVMSGPDGQPLLLLDRVGQGRAALLLSDQIWLWSRDHEGGGPQAELLRRVAHWLMKEPALEEEALTAAVENGTLRSSAAPPRTRRRRRSRSRRRRPRVDRAAARGPPGPCRRLGAGAGAGRVAGERRHAHRLRRRRHGQPAGDRGPARHGGRTGAGGARVRRQRALAGPGRGAGAAAGRRPAASPPGRAGSGCGATTTIW